MKKRKAVVFVLAAVLTLGLLAGCGGSESKGTPAPAESSSQKAAVDLASLKTIGDAFALEGKDEDFVQSAAMPGSYYYVFVIDGTAYRVSADLSDELFQEFLDADGNEEELVADLPIREAEDLTTYKLTQDQLDALVGKNGKELFDAGWRQGMFYNPATHDVWLEFGPFSYALTFDGDPAENSDDYDLEEDLAARKVVSAEFEGMGDAIPFE